MKKMNYSVECITVDGSNDLRSPVKNSQSSMHSNLSITIDKINSTESFNKDNDKNCNEQEAEVIDFPTIANDFLSKFENLQNEEKYQILMQLVAKHFPNQPESLIMITAGTFFCGDCERLPDEVPCWLDREKFARGQKFARDNLFGLFFAELLSLFILFSFEDGLKPMIITGKSSEPYTAFKRYLSTCTRVRNWYNSDPWIKGSPAYNDIEMVRKMHAAVRNKLNNSSNEEIDKAATIEKVWASTKNILIEDFRNVCPAALPGQCPYALKEMRGNNRPKGINQGEMASTQCGFVCLMVLFPDKFGVYNASDEDLDAFCHLWRGIGYLLGIRDEFNFCKGNLMDIKKRSKDFLDYWVKPNLRNITSEWEHMMRCVHAGMKYYFPGSSYEMNLLFLTELMELHMPQLQSSLTCAEWMHYNITKFLMKYPFRNLRIKLFFNKRLNQCIDRAWKYDDEKHEKLRERSTKTLANISNDLPNISDQSSINTKSFFQYKFFGLLVLCAQGFIIWKVKLFSC